LLAAQAVAESRLDRAGHRHPATQARQSRAHTFSFFQKENLACTKRKNNQT